MYAEFHLSPKVLFGVHVGRGGKGVIEEDESVPLHVEGQVGTRGEEVVLSILLCEREPLCPTGKRHNCETYGRTDRMHKDATQTAATVNIVEREREVPGSNHGTEDYGHYAINQAFRKSFPGK